MKLHRHGERVGRTRCGRRIGVELGPKRVVSEARFKALPEAERCGVCAK